MSETPVLILISGILTGNLKDIYCKFSHLKLNNKSVNKKSFFQNVSHWSVRFFFFYRNKEFVSIQQQWNILLFTQLLFPGFHAVLFSWAVLSLEFTKVDKLNFSRKADLILPQKINKKKIYDFAVSSPVFTYSKETGKDANLIVYFLLVPLTDRCLFMRGSPEWLWI